MTAAPNGAEAAAKREADAARVAVLRCYWIVDHPEVRDQVR
ncbi:hypothetical protein [Actinokineospora sp.]